MMYYAYEMSRENPHIPPLIKSDIEFQLGTFYVEAVGVPAFRQEGFRLINQAAQTGHCAAKKFIRESLPATSASLQPQNHFQQLAQRTELLETESIKTESQEAGDAQRVKNTSHVRNVRQKPVMGRDI